MKTGAGLQLGRSKPAPGTADWTLARSSRAGKRQGRALVQLSGERGPASTLISDFQPPEPGDNTFLGFEAPQFVVLCYSSPGKLNTHALRKMSVPSTSLTRSPGCDREP